MFVTFSHGEVIRGYDYHLRRSDTRINPFSRSGATVQLECNGTLLIRGPLGRKW